MPGPHWRGGLVMTLGGVPCWPGWACPAANARLGVSAAAPGRPAADLIGGPRGEQTVRSVEVDPALLIRVRVRLLHTADLAVQDLPLPIDEHAQEQHDIM